MYRWDWEWVDGEAEWDPVDNTYTVARDYCEWIEVTRGDRLILLLRHPEDDQIDFIRMAVAALGGSGPQWQVNPSSTGRAA